MATVGEVGIGVAAEEAEFALWNARVPSWLVLACGSSEEALLELRRRWQSSVGTRSQKAVSLEEAASVGCCTTVGQYKLPVLVRL